LAKQSETFEPTQKMLDYLEALAEPGLKQSISAICGKAGIERSSYYRWLDTEGFEEWLNSEYSKRRRGRKHGAINAMEAKALGGDVNAYKAWMQTDDTLAYRPANAVEMTGKGGGPVEIVIASLQPAEDEEEDSREE
jgi:hypothetical protein